MTDQQTYEFDPEKVAEAFGHTIIGARCNEEDMSPDELAAYLNEALGQADKRAIANLKDKKTVDTDTGEIRMKRPVPFEEWKDRTGYEDDANDD